MEEKACRVIEILVSDDFCEDLEFRIGVHDDYKVSEKEVALINQKICAIYRLTHAANPNNSCYHVHDDWRKEIERKYNYFRRKGYFKKLDLENKNVSS